MARQPGETTYLTSEKFQRRLLALIEDSDLTKLEFAKAAGVSKEIIIRALTYGIVPSVRSLVKLADFLKVPLDFLLGETDNNYFNPAEKPKSFHERLKELSESTSQKYSAIANRMPFAKNSIYEWMRTGSLPSLVYLKDLAAYFKVNVDYLLGRTDDKRI